MLGLLQLGHGAADGCNMILPSLASATDGCNMILPALASATDGCNMILPALASAADGCNTKSVIWYVTFPLLLIKNAIFLDGLCYEGDPTP